jgi:hypothetical protein
MQIHSVIDWVIFSHSRVPGELGDHIGSNIRDDAASDDGSEGNIQ